MKKKGLNSWRSWVVAVVCAIIFCLFATVYRLAAIFYAALVDQFGMDRKSASVPFAALGFVRLSSGAIFGVLGERFGLRRMTFVGCYVAAIGLATSFFAQEVIAFSITIGLMYGFGMTCTALLPSIIRSHFDKTATTLSNGILNIGPAVCGLVFPSLLIYLLDEYGVSGTLLLSSGILLNSLPLIMILKKPKDSTSKVQTKNTQNKKLYENHQIKVEHDFLEKQNQNIQPTTNENQINVFKDNNNIQVPQASEDNILAVTITSTFINKKIPKCLAHNHERCPCLAMAQNEYVSQVCLKKSEKTISPIPNDDNNKEINSELVSKLMNATSEPSYNNEKTMIHEMQSPIKDSDKTTNDENRSKSKGFFHSLNVVKDPTFLALTFVQGMMVYTYNVWLTTLIDYSRDKEIDRSYEIYILTLNSVTDVLGRVALPWVTDKDYLTVAKLSALFFLSFSASSAWMAAANNFGMYTAGVMLMTFTTGAFLNICPEMSYEYIEKDKQILSITSFGTLYAPISFTVSPMIGYFREQLGSYDGLYYLLAAINLACCIIVLMLPKLAERRERRKVKKCESSTP